MPHGRRNARSWLPDSPKDVVAPPAAEKRPSVVLAPLSRVRLRRLRTVWFGRVPRDEPVVPPATDRYRTILKPVQRPQSRARRARVWWGAVVQAADRIVPITLVLPIRRLRRVTAQVRLPGPARETPVVLVPKRPTPILRSNRRTYTRRLKRGIVRFGRRIIELITPPTGKFSWGVVTVNPVFAYDAATVSTVFETGGTTIAAVFGHDEETVGPAFSVDTTTVDAVFSTGDVELS
jgi:hypothetical protein